jgi:23S rRNA (uridine2552-2'-O)-methyltransferase
MDQSWSILNVGDARHSPSMSDEAPKPERRRMVKPPSGGTAAGRSMGTKMKTADTKSMSSQQWIKRQLSDKWSEKARAEGWRSRAAFKLIEIDDRFRLIKPGSRVIDLGAAPGGWVQVALKRGAKAVVGVDLLPIEPVPGAELIQADFTHPGVAEQMMELLGGAPDLVLSDMAHNTVGHRQTDHLKIIALIEIAADFAICTLRPGGAFVSKNFQGGDAGGVLARLREEFETVKYVKPASSRKDSAEVFLVALNKR